jgi:hypothetical protein
MPPQAPQPRSNSADVTVSILLIVVTVLAVGAGSLMGVFSLAFLDHCPPETCSTDGAVTASMTTVAIAALVGLAGIVTTIIRLATRKRAWPLAIGTLAACMAVFFFGAMAYTAAVS